MKKLNLLGQKFGRLTVIAEAPQRGTQTRWLCRCDCGNKTECLTGNLRSGGATSCGCYARERASSRSRTHGLRHTKEYQSWRSMKKRCLNVNHDNWHNYGGQGVQVCDRWLHSFENFLEDMGFAPSPQHTLDRKDNEKGYLAENCRWSTPLEQSNNKRTNLRPVFEGKTYTTLNALARALNIKTSRLKYFHRTCGLELSEAVSRACKTKEEP